MWVALESREKGFPEQIGQLIRVSKIGQLKRIIMFLFFKKPMANPCPNLRRSGPPEGTKRATVTNEIIRRLKNTSRELGPETIKAVPTDYLRQLAIGSDPVD